MPSDEPENINYNMLREMLRAEAIIDYVATTPENINYNMLREMLRALINKEDHPYFQYYADKMHSAIPGETTGDLGHLA